MTKEWNLLKHHSILALIRSGFPSSDLTQEEARKILDDLIRNGSDEEFDIISKRVAYNEMMQGGNYDSEYAIHLAYLKDKRKTLRAEAVTPQ